MKLKKKGLFIYIRNAGESFYITLTADPEDAYQVINDFQKDVRNAAKELGNMQRCPPKMRSVLPGMAGRPVKRLRKRRDLIPCPCIVERIREQNKGNGTWMAYMENPEWAGMVYCPQARTPPYGLKITAAPVAVPLFADLFAAQAKDAGRHCPPCKGDLPDIRGMAVGTLDAEAAAPGAAFRKGFRTIHIFKHFVSS